MKKLMVGMAIAFAAVASQAANVQWSVMNVQSPETGVGQADWLVQVYDAATAYSYDAAKKGTITALDAQLTVKNGTTTTFKGSGTVDAAFAPGDKMTWYAVIYDADTVEAASHYIVSADLAKTVASSGAAPLFAFGNMGATTTANLFKDSTWQTVPSGDVPEPTSAMLLLLGVAGLALKRRNA